MNVQTMTHFLKEQFGQLESIPAGKSVVLLRLLDTAPPEALKLLVKERVKFCWLPALRRLVDMGYDRDQLLRRT